VPGDQNGGVWLFARGLLMQTALGFKPKLFGLSAWAAIVFVDLLCQRSDFVMSGISVGGVN